MEEFTRGLFFVEEGEVWVSSELGGRKDFTQRTQRKRTEFTEAGKEKSWLKRPALHLGRKKVEEKGKEHRLKPMLLVRYGWREKLKGRR